MKLKIANHLDSPSLVEFFKEFPVKGLVDLKVDRNKDFFAPYQAQADFYRTYLLEDEEKTLHGAASIIVRDASQENKIIKVASATDLRIRPNRKAILQWSQHFLPVLEKEMKEHQLSSIFSTINLSDPTALNAFIRPRNMKRAMPRYFLYRKFRMVSLHGKYPWAYKPLSSIKIRNGSAANVDALAAYIIKRSQFRPFASVWDFQSFEKKVSRLTGLQLSDFHVAFDSDENIVGCLAPWSSSGIQDLVPLSYSLQAHNFRQFLKFFWIFGMTRRLAKPVVSTGEESKLQFRYLTHVFADNEDVFENLLYSAFESVTAQEFLLYAHAEQDYRLLPPQTWISASLPYALYAVVPPESEMPAFLHPSISMNPEIEAHTVL
jgi:hypothetical protein